MYSQDIELIDVGFNFELNFIWTIIMAVLLIAFMIMIVLVKIDDKSYQKTKDGYKDVEFFMPKTKQEYHYTLIMSFTAGISEEIIFRGFLIYFFEPIIGILSSIILINVLFSLNHIWSGLKNMLGTMILGLILTAFYLLTGSILFAIVLHILVDIYAMKTNYALAEYEQDLKIIKQN